MKSLYRKLFLDGDWGIALRRKVDWAGEFSYKQGFKSVCNDKKYWYADPILVTNEEKEYLFCEAFDRKQYKGVIGVFEINNDEVKNFQVIIEEGYHLSYPCVFRYNNDFYMIPESGENGTINLYKAKEFPYRWEMEKVLVSGRTYADPTVFMIDDKVYFMAYNELLGNYTNCLFEIDMDLCTVKEVYKIKYKLNNGRPAGPMFHKNKEWFRPAQDSRELYGKSIVLYKLNLSGVRIIENPCFTFDNSKLVIDDKAGVDRIHTYSSTDMHEAIDYCNYHFKITKRLAILKRAKRIKQRKMKLKTIIKETK